MLPSTPPSLTSEASSINKSKLRKKRKLILKQKKKRKEKYGEIIDAVPATEKTALVIHSTFKEPSQVKANLEKAKNILYASHLVAKFSDFGWQFCLILFLTALTDYKSLALVSTYGLFTGIVVCLAGPSAGAFVDSKDRKRLHIAQFFIWVQNLSVIVATTCCFFLLRSVPVVGQGNDEGSNPESAKIGSEIFPDLAPSATYTTWLLLVTVHIFGACGKLADQSMTVAMERDWVVVMSKVAGGDHFEEDIDSDEDQKYLSQRSDCQDSDLSSLSTGDISFGSYTELNDSIIRNLKEKTWLSNTNTVMKQIELVCKVAAPSGAGLFFGLFDNQKVGNDDVLVQSHWNKLSFAALIIGILNIISLAIEYSLIQKIYELVPLLEVRNDPNENETEIEASAKLNIPLGDSHTNELDSMPEKVSSTIQSGKTQTASLSVLSGGKNSRNYPFTLLRGLKLYMQQPIFFGGFALSLLYLNVLSFAALMTAYLVWRRMSYEAIGILKGVSSTIGLLGTVAYHISSRRHTLSFTGSWSIIFQFSCLTICCASLYVSNDSLSLTMLVSGVIVSRIGLWVFDLTITQIMQQKIPEDIRGVIGGVQKSLNSFFDLTTYGLGLIFYDPSDFYILVMTGFGSVGVAMCVYLLGLHYQKDVMKGV